METAEGTASNFVDKLCSVLASKKIVLIFENKIGGANSSIILDVFEEIKRLKKTPKYKRFLKNLRIITASSKKCSKKANKYLDKNTEVFIFARDSARGNLGKIKPKVHLTYINEEEYSWDTYYPLAEIVAITLSQYLDPNTLDNIKDLLEGLNIAAAPLGGGPIIFTLLPDAAKYNKQDLIRKYAALKRALIAA